jgi:hypothetical protein
VRDGDEVVAKDHLGHGDGQARGERVDGACFEDGQFAGSDEEGGLGVGAGCFVGGLGGWGGWWGGGGGWLLWVLLLVVGGPFWVGVVFVLLGEGLVVVGSVAAVVG